MINVKRPAILFLSMSLLMMSQACSKKIDGEKELDNLLQTDREFSRFSTENGAAEAFKKYLLENAVQLPAGQNPLQGRDNIYEDMLNAESDYTLSWVPQDGDVSASGDMGYTWGVYTLSFQSDSGEYLSRNGKYLNVWKKDDKGGWRVLIDMGNQNPN